MKKIFCFIISLIILLSCLSFSVSIAEQEPEIIQLESTFLNTASPADLLNLRYQINEKLYNSPEYESVPVPAGIYQVGEDIPEGKWTLSTTVNSDMMIGDKLKKNGKEVDYWDSSAYASDSHLFFLNTRLYTDNKIIKTMQQTVDFPTGYYVEISRGTVYFSTYTGQPDFLFYAAVLPNTNITKLLDLSSYDFNGLVELKNKLNLQIWNSYNWNQVIVPAGLYQIGTDIPAGNWIIEPPEQYTRIIYGTKLNERNMRLVISDDWKKEIENVNYLNYKEGEDVSSIDLAVADKAYLMINENTCASFKPSSGKKQTLGFKKYATEESVDNSESGQAATYQLFTIDNSTSGTSASSITSSGQPVTVQKIIFNDTEYELMDYDDVARNPNSNKGKKIYFLGKVIQVSESTWGTSTTYRIEIDNTDDVVYVQKYSKTEPRVLQNDHVIVCGTCTGVESYQSVLGGTITIPGCTADDISDANNLYSRIPTTTPDELQAQRQPDPLVIASCTTGENPTIVLTNNSGKTTKEMGFRCRYYDQNHVLILLDTTSTLTENSYNNWSTINSTFEVEDQQTGTIDCSSVPSFIQADHAEIALNYIVFSDDSVYFVPESDMYWFSSKTNDYIPSNKLFNYTYPDQDTFNKANSFMLGAYYYQILPEYVEHYNLSETGFLITEITDESILKQLGVQNGDIILSCDGVYPLDDPYCIDKSKAKLADGNNITIILSRNGEQITITVTPEMVEANRS